MADGLTIKHPVSGDVIFSAGTVTSHSRASFNTTGSAGSLNVSSLIRGEPFIIQALPSDASASYNLPDFNISGSNISWNSASRNMRVLVGSRAAGAGSGAQTFDGLSIKVPSGAVQISNADFALQLVSYGSVLLTDDGANHPQPMVTGSVTVSGVNPVLAFRPAVGARVTITRIAVSGNNYTFYFRCQSYGSVGVVYWVFDVAGQALAINTDVALVLKDGTNTKTFDSRAYAMNFVDHVVKTDDTVSTVNAPSGRTYAAIQSSYSYHGTFQDAGAFGSGQNPPVNAEIGDPDMPRPIGAKWSYMVLSSVETTASSLSNGGMSVGMRQFEFYQDWYPLPGNDEQDNRYGTSRHTIIDVTGFPSAEMPTPNTVSVSVNPLTLEASTSAVTSATTTTPEAAGSATGGLPPYSYLWQFVSGSPDVAAFGGTTGTTFRTRSTSQPAGSVREAIWRLRVTDNAGNIGYSPNVTFRHSVLAIDASPDPVDWPNVSNSTNSNTGTVEVPSRQITGISDPITIRIERFNYSGNLSSAVLNIYKGPAGAGPWTFLGQFDLTGTATTYLDITVNPGEWVYWWASASTTSGVRSGSWTIGVWNETAGHTTLDTGTMSITVDADDNYNTTDLIPDPVNWPNLSPSSTGTTAEAGAGFYQTISGISQNINIRVAVSGVSGNLSSIYVRAFDGGTLYATLTSNGANNTRAFSNGDTLGFICGGTSTGGYRSGSFTVTITNTSTGDVLDTFTVNVEVDTDNDFDPVSVNWPNLSINTTANSGSAGGGFYQSFTGINVDISVRVQVTGYSGNLTSFGLQCFDTDTSYGTITSNNGQLTRTFSPGDRLGFIASASTTGGNRSGSFTVTVTNVTSGQVLDTFTVTANVDTDADATPNAVDWPNLTINTTGNSGSAGAGFYQAFNGINMDINVRVAISGLTGDLSAISLTPYDGGTAYGPISSNGASVDRVFSPGDSLGFIAAASTTSGLRSGSFTVTITNLTMGQVLDTFTVNATVDSDNNYNNALSVSVTPSSISSQQIAGQGQSITTYVSGLTVQVSGAIGSVSYTWEKVSGLAGWQVIGTTNPTFSYTGTTNYSQSATFRLKVSDGGGRIAYSSNILVMASAGNNVN